VRDESGSVLQDLGVLRDGSSPSPQNFAKDAVVFGGSMFDTMINLRNHLRNGDQANIGGDVLRGLDSAMGNLLGNLGSLGAKTARLELAYKTTEKLLPDYQARNSLEVDLDMTKAITDYKVLEQTHEAALSTAAKLMKVSLLDFLR
jgi:flagellar hook-associated protein 3 FlgL